MGQLTFVEPGVLAWQDAPDPQAGPGQAMVRPLAVSRCDLDIAMAAFGLFPGPFTVGHEIAAEVVEVGPGVERIRTGQRVAVPFQVSCGTCAPCSERHYAACLPNQARAGAAFGFGEAGGGHGGGLADLLLVSGADHLLVAAPPSISDVALATVPDNVIDGYRAVGDGLRERPGSDALIVGGDAPSISLYTILCAQALGAGRIRYADGDPQRLAAAADLGADVVDVGGEFPRRLDRAPIVVAASLQQDGLNCAIRSTEAYGRLTSVTIHFTPEGAAAVARNVHARNHFRHPVGGLPTLPTGVARLGGDAVRVDPRAVPTGIVGWDDAAADPARQLFTVQLT